MPRALRALALWAPPLAFMAMIFAFSAMPSDGEDRGALVFLLRKVAHFTEYALLMALWWRALRTKLAVRTAVIAAFAVSVAYAATDELHQHYVDGRVPTPMDVLIDAAGAATVGAVILRRRPAVPA